ncbi:hypothetical protein LDL08_06270 [Nonomuraea glycinis]|uniref:hypothetical protein n=1 Tax=Nonomuraea glycinis TaxID=2047744 RepID=UPI00166B841C|nr:hypothetical protein [Nonomuraea glycinis]MCA2175789.1 hypothetical protein [Nonomuraea glycinis]
MLGAGREAGATALERLAGDGRTAAPARAEAVRTLLEAGQPVAYDLVRPLLGSEYLWSGLLSAAGYAQPALDLLVELVRDQRVPAVRRIRAVAVVLPSGHPAAVTSVDALIGDSRLEPGDLLQLGHVLNGLGEPRAQHVLRQVAENRSAPFAYRLEAAQSMDSEARSAVLRALAWHRRLRPVERLRALNELLNNPAYRWHTLPESPERRALLRLRARLEERINQRLIVRIYQAVATVGGGVLGALASPFRYVGGQWKRRAYRNSRLYKRLRRVFQSLRRRRLAAAEGVGVGRTLNPDMLLTLELDIERQAAVAEAEAKQQIAKMRSDLPAV